MEIKAGRSGMFYGSLVVVSVLCVGLGTLIAFLSLSIEPVDYTMSLFALVFYFIGVYAIISYSKQTPVVTLGDEGIKFRGRWYGWNQLVSVDFTSQKPMRFLWAGKYMKAATLTFDDGNELYLFDDMHSNMREIRSYLQSRVEIEAHMQEIKEEVEVLTEGEAKSIKRKGRWFTFLVVGGLLLISVLLAVFDAGKGIVILVMVLVNILFIFVLKKMFGKKKDEQDKVN